MKILISIGILFFSISCSFAQTIDSKLLTIGDKKLIFGTWKPNKKCPESILLDNDTAYMDVILGQIEINAKIIYQSKNKILLKFISHTSLGMGGVKLNWKYFSKDSIIASLTFINSDSAKFVWFGFYNTSKQKRDFEKCAFTIGKPSNWSYLIKQPENQ